MESDKVKMISVREFERKVRCVEEIPLVIHAPDSELVPDYYYARQAAANASLTDWQNTRLKPLLGKLEYSIINSDYVPATPNGRSKMETIRSSYER